MRTGCRNDRELESMLRAYGKAVRNGGSAVESGTREKAVAETVALSKNAFFESESRRRISYIEFMTQQLRYIRKLWWILQFVVIAGLYIFITAADSTMDMRRMLGAAAPLFAILMVPELWKNRNAQSIEVETASYFSLRQIYAARMTAFAMADGLLLTAFVISAAAGSVMGVEEILIQFLLPMTVTCCICFRMLCSEAVSSEYIAIFLSLMWTGFWMLVVVDDRIYDRISMPLWTAVLILSIAYFAYVVRKTLTACGEYRGAEVVWD